MGLPEGLVLRQYNDWNPARERPKRSPGVAHPLFPGSLWWGCYKGWTRATVER